MTIQTWAEFVGMKEEKLEEEISISRALFRLELSIIESIRDLVPPDFLDLLSQRFIALREGREAPQTIFYRYKGDERLNAILRASSAVYSYNNVRIRGKRWHWNSAKLVREAASSPIEDVKTVIANFKRCEGTIKFPEGV